MIDLMKKRKYLVFLLLVMLCYFLFPYDARAQSSSQISIYSQGSINYAPAPTPSPSPLPSPTATPTPTPTPTSNLTPFPTGWQVAVSGRENDVLDYSVLYNGAPSIRIDPVGSTTNYARESDGPWLSVKAGDHIVFKCWIKTSTSSIGDPITYHGGRIGIDFYANGRITGTNAPTGGVWTPSEGYPSDNAGTTVTWGTSTWTQVTMDFIVQSQYPADGGYAGWGTQYSAGQMVTPTAIIPWLQVFADSNDIAVGWFAGTVLQINP
jgi:hypothetical protein